MVTLSRKHVARGGASDEMILPEWSLQTERRVVRRRCSPPPLVAASRLIPLSSSSFSPSPLDPPTAPAMMSITSTAAAAAGSPVYTPLVPRGGRRSRCAVRAQAAGGGAAAADGAASEQKSLEIMRKFSEQYARRSSTFFCSDKSVTAVVIKGLADHKDQLGAPLCPCRHYDDKAAEAAQGFWNCPCVPMRERKECHCMLFLTPDNDFAGEDQAISLEEIKEATSKY